MISRLLNFGVYLTLFGCLCGAQILNAKDLSASASSDQPNISHYGQLPEYRSLAISPDGNITP